MAETNAINDTLPEFIPVPMAAKILNISSAKLYSLINGKQLPAYRFGKSWRIKKRDFDNFIKNAKE